MKKLIAGVSLLGIALFGMVLAKIPLSDEHAYRILERSTRLVLTPDRRSGGTAFFFLTSQGHVVLLSNAHVCDNNKTMIVVTGQMWEKVEVVKQDHAVDLCLMYSESHQGLVHSALMPSSGYDLYDTIYSSGFQHLSHENPQKGTIIRRSVLNLRLPPQVTEEGFSFCPPNTLSMGPMGCIKSMEVLETTLTSWPGNSGSPVVNKWGQLVGVVALTDLRSHYGAIVPLDLVLDFLEE